MTTSDHQSSLSIPTAAGEPQEMPAASSSSSEAGHPQGPADGSMAALGCAKASEAAADVLVAAAAGQSSSDSAQIRAFWPEHSAVANPAMTELGVGAAASVTQQMHPAQAGSEPVRTRASRNSRRAQKKAMARTRPAPAGTDAQAAVGPQDGAIAEPEANADDCVVCWSAAAGVIFQPCGHFVCCAACAEPFLAYGMPCPMCRIAVASSVCLVS